MDHLLNLSRDRVRSADGNKATKVPLVWYHDGGFYVAAKGLDRGTLDWPRNEAATRMSAAQLQEPLEGADFRPQNGGGPLRTAEFVRLFLECRLLTTASLPRYAALSRRFAAGQERFEVSHRFGIR
jgi:hypothetical protein